MHSSNDGCDLVCHQFFERIAYNGPAVTQCQPPLVSHETGHLSLPTDSGLQLDVTNGSDLGLVSDSIVGDEFDLTSSSMAYPSVNYDSSFNPNPQSKKMRTSLIKFLENMARYCY